MAALVCTLVVAGLFGLVAAHALLTEGQLDLDRLQEQADRQQARYDRLRLQVAELEAPERVVAVAQQRLGMVPPPGVTYLSPSGVAQVKAATDDGDDERAAGSAWPMVKAQLAGR